MKIRTLVAITMGLILSANAIAENTAQNNDAQNTAKPPHCQPNSPQQDKGTAAKYPEGWHWW